ncbi:MAG TPA: FAD/NAD(P)-binding protein [Pseudonocardiaceae bacterium]|nr:FAD/NAD(P)-binding protein [Pseudonocardiaceae bacterium]
MITFVPPPQLLDSPRGRQWPAYPGPPRTIRVDAPPARPDVVIVGAGPAGLAVASALWHRGAHDVALLDRTGPPCARFFDRIDGLDQRVLRSPYEHHPGVEGHRDCELLDFARLHWSWLSPVERREIRMAQAGHRSVVPVDVFAAFCHHVATVHGVYQRTWHANVRELRPDAQGVHVRTDTAELVARFVVLCLGEERAPAPAGWFADGRPPPCVSHWDEPVPADADSIVVVGAGLTSAHLITQALADGRRVDWVMRTQERYQCSDVNASFFRAEGRARFDGVPWTERLALMARERRASVMFEFQPGLRDAESNGTLTVHRGRAVASIDDEATVRFTDGASLRGDHVVLALGTTPSIGADLLAPGVLGARDGWPALDERTLAYRNAPRVFAVGASACMVLGPAARNIDGHRVATARVAATIAAGLGAPVSDQDDWGEDVHG